MPLALPKSGGIRPYNTTVTIRDGKTVCTLYQTDIAVYDPATNSVTLDTGGYDTPTTIRRMNECLASWGFRQRVCKADFAKADKFNVAKG